MESAKKLSTLKLIANNPHIFGQALGYKKLSKLHGYFIHTAFDEKLGSEVLIQAHRNSYKTTSLSVVGVIWYLLFNPNATFMLLQKESGKAQALVNEIIRHYEGDFLGRLYWDLFGIKKIKTKNWSQQSLTLSTRGNIGKEGSIDAMGLSGGYTGYHYNYIMGDDLVTIVDRTSKAERERTKIQIGELKNIPQLGTGRIVFSGTPWHKEDAHIRMPKPKIKWSLQDSLKSKYFPEITKQQIDTWRMQGASLFAANYDLEHISDEMRLIPDPQYGWVPNLQCVGAIDPAFSGSHFSSLTIAGKRTDLVDGLYYLRGWIWRRDITELVDEIIALLKKYNVGSLFFENNADKGASAKIFSQKWTAVESYAESTNKHIRIIRDVKMNWDKMRFAPDCSPEYINQMLDYQENQEPDDAIDSCAKAMKSIIGYSGNSFYSPGKVY